MRTIAEIKASMTEAFMADATVRELYGLVEGDRFETRFSLVSLENILFGIFAACAYVVESLFALHRTEVDEVAAAAQVATIPWYYAKVMSYQHGDALVLDGETMAYGYEEDAPERRVVKYAAVRDQGTWLQIFAAAEKDGCPTPLTEEQLTGLTAYVDRVKIAGVSVSITSEAAAAIRVQAVVFVDPLVLNTDGSRIIDGSYPVRDAIDAYLAGVVYGGNLNKTKLVDAIQEVPGVADVQLDAVYYSTDGGATYTEVTDKNYQAPGGCFVSADLENTLSYVVEG